MEEQLEDEDDEDVYILSKVTIRWCGQHERDLGSVNQVGDVMHAVFSQYKAAWLPQFERLLPKVTDRMKSDQGLSEWQDGNLMCDNFWE